MYRAMLCGGNFLPFSPLPLSPDSHPSDPETCQLSEAVTSQSVSDEAIIQTMGRCWEENQYLLCPHSAVAMSYHYQQADRRQPRYRWWVPVCRGDPLAFRGPPLPQAGDRGMGTNGLFFFLAAPCCMRDLSSLTRGGTHAPLQWKRRVLTTGPPGKSHKWLS